MDLRDLLSALRAHWKSIISLTVAGGLLAFGFSLLASPTYQSTIQFYVTTDSGVGANAAYQGSLGAQQRVQSYAELVDSNEIAQRVVDESGIDWESAQVADATTASADSNTVLLTLEVTDEDPAHAQQIAEGYGTVLPVVVNELETPDGNDAALASLSVVNSPELPTSPVAPNTLQNVAIGSILGLLLGVALALLMTSLDRKVRSKEQLERFTGRSVVGNIPFRRKGDREEGAEHVVPFRKGHSPAAESFRRLRTNLQFLNIDNPPKMFVVTSSVAAEGKSETTLNIALALAEAHNRVLVVEADLRRPLVHEYLSMSASVGLTTTLTGQTAFTDVVQDTDYEGVDFLASGPLPPNPSELLASDKARELFADLREKYDYVIFDSPPLLPVTDGGILGQLTDGALLVVRKDRTTTDQVAQSIDILEKADAELLAVVMVADKSDSRDAKNYYASYYRQSDPRDEEPPAPVAVREESTVHTTRV